MNENTPSRHETFLSKLDTSSNSLTIIELAQLLASLDDDALMLVLYHAFTMRMVHYWRETR